MKPVAVVKKSLDIPRYKTLHQKKGMGKCKKRYAKCLSKVLCKVTPTTIQQQWAMDWLTSHQDEVPSCSLIALEAARLSHSQRRNTITSKEICTALRNLNSARGRDTVRDEDF